MDPNLFQHLETFLPNGQARALLQEALGIVPLSTQPAAPVNEPHTVGSSDQTFNLLGTSSVTAQQTTAWDAPGLFAGDMETSMSPLEAHPDMLLDSSAAPTAGSSASPKPCSSMPVFGQPTRRMLPARTSHTREGHQRKRSKLSMDLSPLDSAGYWVRFDDEDHLGDVLEHSGLVDTTETRAASTYTAPTALKMEDFLDDSALDNALSEDEGLSSMKLAEQLSTIDSEPPIDVPPREGLYSTPLSWEKPQPGIRTDSLIGLTSGMLTEAEQRRLIAIAMNSGPSMAGLGSNITRSLVGSDAGLSLMLDIGAASSTAQTGQMLSQPRPTPQAAPLNPLQKKDNVAENSQVRGKDRETDREKAKLSCDRTAHNHIERKYRTNLKDKIAELQHAIPALQAASENAGDEEGVQSTRTPKVSKGTILTKATEYIHLLEKKNKQIVQEHRDLSRRLQAFEQLLNATARPSFQMPTYSRTLFDPRGFC